MSNSLNWFNVVFMPPQFAMFLWFFEYPYFDKRTLADIVAIGYVVALVVFLLIFLVGCVASWRETT